MLQSWAVKIAALFLALLAEIAHLYSSGHYAAPLLAALAIILSGLGVYRDGLLALKKFDLNMNALMAVAVTGAMLIKQWPEAAMVMALFNIAEAIEAAAVEKSKKSIENLLSLAPDTATAFTDGQWREVEAREVLPGTIVRVRPGEKVALDGEIVSGASRVNQAPITGESLPVEKTAGDAVFAGSINESGSFEYRVTTEFTNSTLSRIIRAVEEAQEKRAPIERLVEKFAKVYTPAIFAIAFLTALIPPLFLGNWPGWLYKALVLLVIGCPCALVISIPITIVCGLTIAARRGLLIKGGAFLEMGRALSCMAFDKTGTLTTGRPGQTDARPWQMDEAEARALAAALAARSDHPVSRAIYEAAAPEGLAGRYEVTDFKALPGRGIQGLIEGRAVMLGNAEMLREFGHFSAQLGEEIALLENQGKSVAILCGPDGVAAVFATADTVREQSRKAVAALQKLGLVTVMLTGDNPAAAALVGKSVGVDEVRAGLLPEDKLRAIEALKAQGHIVGMVGDGINDAPALASADIGFAMGAAGTDTAIETADVAVMDDNPEKLALFIKLSRSTYRLIRQNITLALGIKLAFFILTFFGATNMWMAVFADIGVTLLVVANGMRILRH